MVDVVLNFYRNVKFLAKKKHITLRSVEAEVGVSPGYISRQVKHHGEIGVTMVYRIAELFEVSPIDLLEGDYRKTERIRQLRSELEALEGGNTYA